MMGVLPNLEFTGINTKSRKFFLILKLSYTKCRDGLLKISRLFYKDGWAKLGQSRIHDNGLPMHKPCCGPQNSDLKVEEVERGGLKNLTQLFK